MFRFNSFSLHTSRAVHHSSVHRRRRPFALIPVVTFGLVYSFPLALGAQIQFPWPAFGVDHSQYIHPEECLALAWRVSDSVRRARPFWRDTLRWDPSEARATYAPAVQTETRACANKFFAETFDVKVISTANTLLQLYLFGQQDREASVLVARAIAAIPKDSVAQQLEAIESFALSYLRAQPSRLPAADSLISLFVKRASSHTAELKTNMLRTLALRLEQFEASERLDALDTARDYATQAMTINRSLPSEDRSTPTYRTRLQRRVIDANNFLLRAEVPDQLRRGTKHYVQWKAEQFGRISGVRLTDVQPGLGDPVSTIVADYWFGTRESATRVPSRREAGVGETGIRESDVRHETSLCDSVTSQPAASDSTDIRYPRSGRNSLIVFVPPQWCLNEQRCWASFAALRRLADEFPKLDMVLVTKTRGFFGPMAPPDPPTEAGKMCGYLLEFHRIPATLAVSNTAFIRLPGLDRRRIDEETENAQNYSQGGMIGIGDASIAFYLVDSIGLLVHATQGFNRVEESQLRQLISSLESR